MKILFVSFLLILSSCKFFPEKSSLSFEEKGKFKGLGTARIEFKEIHSKILKPHCIECHSGYANYNTVFNQKTEILKSVKNNTMPKNKQPLSKDLKQLLSDWIDQGAIYENGVEVLSTNMSLGLNEAMKELHKQHNVFHPELDKENKVELSTNGEVPTYPVRTGGKVEVQYKLSKTYKSVIRMDLTENTCGHFRPQTCLFALKYKIYDKRLAWIENNNKDKINQTIEVSTDGEDDLQTVEQSDFLTQGITAFAPMLDYGIKNYLICENWDWTGGEDLNVLSWSAETMRENEETGVTENTIIGSAYNLKFKSFDKNVYQIDSLKFVEARFNRTALAYLIGDAGAIYYQKGDEQCAISYKLDNAKLISDARQAAVKESKNQTYKQYHMNQDNTFHPDDDDTISNGIDDLDDVDGIYR